MIENDMSDEFDYVLNAMTEGLSSSDDKDVLDMSEFQGFLQAVDALTDEQLARLAGPEGERPEILQSNPVDPVADLDSRALHEYHIWSVTDKFSLYHEVTKAISMEALYLTSSVCCIASSASAAGIAVLTHRVASKSADISAYRVFSDDIHRAYIANKPTSRAQSKEDRVVKYPDRHVDAYAELHVKAIKVRDHFTLSELLEACGSGPIYCDWSPGNSPIGITPMMALPPAKRYVET